MVSAIGEVLQLTPEETNEYDCFAPFHGPLRRVPKVVSLSLAGDPRVVSASFSAEPLGSV